MIRTCHDRDLETLVEGNLSMALELNMERAGQEQPGRMAAIVGMGDADVHEVCRLSGAEVCNYNSTSQIVVGGTPEAVAYLNL